MDVKLFVVAWPEDAPRGAVSRFCREHQVSRSWFYDLRARLGREGLDALRRKPLPVRSSVPVEVEELAVRVRKELADDGLDNGPISVRDTMVGMGIAAPSRATLARIFTRRGLVVPQPQKRPRSACRRFVADQVHERWQLDSFDWPLAGGEPAVVLQMLDDRSRVLTSLAAEGETSAAAIAVFDLMVNDFQVPGQLLTDNGTALNPQRRGWEGQLARHAQVLGVQPITGRPGHPQTQGKDERVHATTQKWLKARPRAATLEELQDQLDRFDGVYNFRRGHQALGLDPLTGRLRTPAQALAAGPVAIPPAPPDPPRAQARLQSRAVVVRALGKITVVNKIIQVGTERVGQTLHVVVDQETVTIFDGQGRLIRTVLLTLDVRYYGSGEPRGGRRIGKGRASREPGQAPASP